MSDATISILHTYWDHDEQGIHAMTDNWQTVTKKVTSGCILEQCQYSVFYLYAKHERMKEILEEDDQRFKISERNINYIL